MFLELATYTGVGISHLETGQILACFRNNFRITLDAQWSTFHLSSQKLCEKEGTNLTGNLHKTRSHQDFTSSRCEDFTSMASAASTQLQHKQQQFLLRRGSLGWRKREVQNSAQILKLSDGVTYSMQRERMERKYSSKTLTKPKHLESGLKHDYWMN